MGGNVTFSTVTEVTDGNAIAIVIECDVNLRNVWRSLGIYTDSEAEAIDKFLSVFKDLTFPPGSSILFTVSPNGSLTVSLTHASYAMFILF